MLCHRGIKCSNSRRHTLILQPIAFITKCIMKGGECSMDKKKILGALGIVATVIGFGATMLSDFVKEKRDGPIVVAVWADDGKNLFHFG